MITLSLSDWKQSSIAIGTSITLEGRELKLSNEKTVKNFLVAANESVYGTYWIDAISHSIFVELFSDKGLITSFIIYLGSEFEEMFPNAYSNWGSYFFHLHYSTG
jgi:hypothetical protein